MSGPAVHQQQLPSCHHWGDAEPTALMASEDGHPARRLASGSAGPSASSGSALAHTGPLLPSLEPQRPVAPPTRAQQNVPRPGSLKPCCKIGLLQKRLHFPDGETEALPVHTCQSSQCCSQELARPGRSTIPELLWVLEAVCSSLLSGTSKPGEPKGLPGTRDPTAPHQSLLSAVKTKQQQRLDPELALSP